MGAVTDAYAGAEIALPIDGNALTKVFAVFVAVIGARSIYKGARSITE